MITLTQASVKLMVPCPGKCRNASINSRAQYLASILQATRFAVRLSETKAAMVNWSPSVARMGNLTKCLEHAALQVANNAKCDAKSRGPKIHLEFSEQRHAGFAPPLDPATILMERFPMAPGFSPLAFLPKDKAGALFQHYASKDAPPPNPT